MMGKTLVGRRPCSKPLLLGGASQTICFLLLLLLLLLIYTKFFLCKDAQYCTLLYFHAAQADTLIINDTKVSGELAAAAAAAARSAGSHVQEELQETGGNITHSSSTSTVPAQLGLSVHPFTSLLTKLVKEEKQTKQLETGRIACEYKYFYPVFCVLNNMVSVESSRVQFVPSQLNNSAVVPPPNDETVQVSPYAWHQSEGPLKSITPVKIHTNAAAPPAACEYSHHVPAVIFSSGGFIGNLFHEFDEIIVPLFLTARLFQSNVQFIITDFNPHFVNKYSSILSGLSRFPIINPVENSSVHCFPAAVVGLKFHSSLAIKSTDAPPGYSMLAFKEFLRETYELKVIDIVASTKKPILILISREETRKFVNEGEMVKMMEALGFQVMVARTKEMSNLEAFSKILGSCSVLVGAHGAGLTNQIFLPVGALLVQVVPLGLQWPSRACFGDPAQGMGVKYLEYKIEPEESTLFDVYGPDHPVITDPASLFAKGYQVGRAVYLESQNIKVNVTRFRETLVEAIPLIIGHR